MNEKLKDTTIDLLLDGVKTKIEDVKENYKWQELFVSTGSFCVNNPDTLTMFEQDLFLVFSKDNLKQMAKKLKDKRGYEFPQLLHRELYDLMVRYEIPAMEAETYIHHFIQVIINYLEENDPDKTYVHEVNKTYIEYLMMCVDSACTDAEKWNKIIQHIKSYDVTIQNEVFKKLILNCREMCDEEKIKIKNEMRYEIYRHRYYHDADWSISEEMLCKYESTMNEIVLSDKVYEYLYIFSPVYEFPLLHPVPFSREECKDLREKNHILREEEIKTRVRVSYSSKIF